MESRTPHAGPETITFPSGGQARVVRAPRTAAGGELVRALELPPARGVVVLNGGTAELEGELEQRLRVLLADGLARAVAEEGLSAVTGGTDAGIFSLFGSGLAEHSRVASVGVAPAALVGLPGRSAAGSEVVPLEPHHSHFVLVDGEEWGDETATMMQLTATLAADAPSLAVLAGGGSVAKTELVAHVRAGRDVIVLAGSGRLADEVAAAVAAGGIPSDAELGEAVASGRVTVFEVSHPPEELRKLVRSRMSRQPGRRFAPPEHPPAS